MEKLRRKKNGARRTRDIEDKVTRVGASKPEASEFQLRIRKF